MTSSNDLLSKANIMRFSTQLVDNMLEKRKKERISEDSFNSEIDGIFDQDREDTITGFKIVKNAQHFRDRRKKMNTKFNSLSPKEKLKLNELNSTAYLDLNSIINSAPRAFPKASDELKWSFDTWGNFIMHELKSITKDPELIMLLLRGLKESFRSCLREHIKVINLKEDEIDRATMEEISQGGREVSDVIQSEEGQQILKKTKKKLRKRINDNEGANNRSHRTL